MSEQRAEIYVLGKGTEGASAFPPSEEGLINSGNGPDPEFLQRRDRSKPEPEPDTTK